MAARSVTSPFYTIEETIEVLSDAITFSKTTPDAISRLNKCAELIRDPQLYDRAKIDLVNLLWMTMPAFETTASMKALNERGALIEYVQAWGDPRNGIAEMAKAPGIVGSLEDAVSHANREIKQMIEILGLKAEPMGRFQPGSDRDYAWKPVFPGDPSAIGQFMNAMMGRSTVGEEKKMAQVVEVVDDDGSDTASLSEGTGDVAKTRSGQK